MQFSFPYRGFQNILDTHYRLCYNMYKGAIHMRINKDDYKKMKLAMETKRFSVLKDLNLAEGVSELALRKVLKDNAYAGVSLEDTFSPIELIDGPTGMITQEELEALWNSEECKNFFKANGIAQ